MTSHYLKHFFNPASIAVVGAGAGAGLRLFRRLRQGGYAGALYPVDAAAEVDGLPAHASLAATPAAPELAVLSGPLDEAEQLLAQCGARGVRAAMITAPAPRDWHDAAARRPQALLETARRHGVRLIGPGCLGLMRPGLGLDAIDSRLPALPGKLALVTQSGALCNAMLDWAHERGVGFSTVLSLGAGLDVDFGDILDYLSTDRDTHSILLYIETLQAARRFMSGLRAAARLKPVVVVKAGRHAGGSRAAVSHTGLMVGADDVFDAALARAGAVRAGSIDQLFSAAAVLSSGYRVRGNRLAIVGNGGGPGILAADCAGALGLTVAAFDEVTAAELAKALPDSARPGNPLDLMADADPARYQSAVTACLADPAIDGVLVLLAPQSLSQPLETAERMALTGARNGKPLLACWMGGTEVRPARARLAASRVPQFETPEAAVEAYGYLAQYHRSQQLLLQVPGAVAVPREPSAQGARSIIDAALAEGRRNLTPMESKALLSAFEVPVVRTVEARSAAEALTLADSIGYPVAMKIASADISHKSRIGGVRLNIANAAAVRAAYADLRAGAELAQPGAVVSGVTVEPMHGKPNGRELIVGIAWDEVFGPVISFGTGGTLVELIRDRAVALPPLNGLIAQDLIRRTRIAAALGVYQGLPAVDMEALVQVLLRVSNMVCELPQIREMDINPLVLDEAGALAVDVRVAVEPAPPGGDRYPRMAITPYPSHLASRLELADGTVIGVRPIRPEDAALEHDFMSRLSQTTRYFRFMDSMSELSPSLLVRFTQIDYDREMALVALHADDEDEQIVAIARYTTLPDGDSCEFALTVADAWQGRGIGHRLMVCLMRAAGAHGLVRMQGEVLGANRKMLELMKKLGFSIHASTEDFSIRAVEKALD